MSKQLILQLGALAVLALFLGMRLYIRRREAWRQRRADLARERDFRSRWQPVSFDSAPIAGQIRRLRQDFAAVAHSRPRQPSDRAGLIRSARTAVLRCSYFQGAKARTPDCPEGELVRHPA
jgi:hypothetical protein